MKIGIDIDDCVTKTTELFCSTYNRIFGRNLSFLDLTSETAKFEDMGILNLEEVQKVKNEYFLKKSFRDVEPVEYSVEVLKKLEKRHNIFFITSRSDYAIEDLEFDTRYWFEKHEIKNYELYFTKEKRSLYKKLDLQIVIEDSIIYMRSIAELRGVELGYLISRPWNLYSNLPLKVNRVDSWLDIFKQIENEKHQN